MHLPSFRGTWKCSWIWFAWKNVVFCSTIIGLKRVYRIYHICKWFHLKGMCFCNFVQPPNVFEGPVFSFSAVFLAKECCLVWFQLAFAAGAMLLFAFPYIHIGAKLDVGKILGRKFDLWKMLGGLQVCLCSFLMMDVHICFIFTPIWARLPSWPRFFQMGWYGRTLGIVPLINPIYTEK